MDNFSLYFVAAILSELGEKPLHLHEDASLRITYMPSFTPHYCARLQSSGNIIYKYARGPGRDELPPSPAKEVLFGSAPSASLENLNQFFYDVSIRDNVVIHELFCNSEVQRELSAALDSIAEAPVISAPEALQLDGFPVFLEFGKRDEFLELRRGHEYSEPSLNSILKLIDMIEDLGSDFLAPVFTRRSVLYTLTPALLNTLLEKELPSVIALLFAFAPSDSMLSYLETYRAGQAEEIKAAAKQIDRRSQLSADLFYEVERVIVRKINATTS